MYDLHVNPNGISNNLFRWILPILWKLSSWHLKCLFWLYLCYYTLILSRHSLLKHLICNIQYTESNMWKKITSTQLKFVIPNISRSGTVIKICNTIVRIVLDEMLRLNSSKYCKLWTRTLHQAQMSVITKIGLCSNHTGCIPHTKFGIFGYYKSFPGRGNKYRWLCFPLLNRLIDRALSQKRRQFFKGTFFEIVRGTLLT